MDQFRLAHSFQTASKKHNFGNSTGQLVRGDGARAQTGLKAFGSSLNDIPDIDRPALPEKPDRNRN